MKRPRVLTLLTSIPLALVVGVLAPATSALADEDDGAADGSSATDSGSDPAADDAFGGSAGGVGDSVAATGGSNNTPAGDPSGPSVGGTGPTPTQHDGLGSQAPPAGVPFSASGFTSGVPPYGSGPGQLPGGTGVGGIGQVPTADYAPQNSTESE
jgi:hypothetical protein